MLKYLIKPRRRYRATYKYRPLNNPTSKEKVVKAHSLEEAFALAKEVAPQYMELVTCRPLKRRLRNWQFNMPTSVGIFLLGIAVTAPFWTVRSADSDVQFHRVEQCPPTTTTAPSPPTGIPVVVHEDDYRWNCREYGNAYCGLLGQETAY